MELLRHISYVVYLSIPIFSLLSLYKLRPAKIAIHSTNNAATKSIIDLIKLRTPTALFPPSALIGLKDDNATFFIARPAAFGPPLPSNGLIGHLWLASNSQSHKFELSRALDSFHEELGCDDTYELDEKKSEAYEPDAEQFVSPSDDTLLDSDGECSTRQAYHSVSESNLVSGDRTGEHVKHHVNGQGKLSGAFSISNPNSAAKHAAIQSLQEKSGIIGKIFLLRRGGCRFLDKVKWAQRRGGAAVIVGDNIPGRALVTMHAQNDAFGVTIPALFTTYSTAQFLSSLTAPKELRKSLSGYDDFTEKTTKQANNHIKFVVPNEHHVWYDKSVSRLKQMTNDRAIYLRKLLAIHSKKILYVLNFCNRFSERLWIFADATQLKKDVRTLEDVAVSSDISNRIYFDPKCTFRNAQTTEAPLLFSKTQGASNADQPTIDVYDRRDPDKFKDGDPVVSTTPPKSLFGSRYYSACDDHVHRAELKSSELKSSFNRISDTEHATGFARKLQTHVTLQVMGRDCYNPKTKLRALMIITTQRLEMRRSTTAWELRLMTLIC